LLPGSGQNTIKPCANIGAGSIQGGNMEPMFSEMKKETGTKDLIGLKITKVISNLHDTIKSIQCEDEHGEIHEITFHPIDSSYIAIKLDCTEILNIETEV
jgi:hypothetical protein